ncbi:MAG: hypothetical protein ACKOB9_00280 [Solirubrobacterales bacterium]
MIADFYASFSAAALRAAVPEAGDEEIARAARLSAELINAMPFPTGPAMNAAAALLAARVRLAEGDPLEALDPDVRDRWMDRWAGAAAPPLGQLAAGVRSIALAAYYSRQPGR